MGLTRFEIESCRALLGYGAITVDASPYTPDGWWSLFDSIVLPYLSTAPETTSETPITGGTSVEVTPMSMIGIVPNEKLVVDVIPNLEKVVVQSVTATTFRAFFTQAHPATGYPIAVQSGVTRVRELLAEADRLISASIGSGITQTAGLKQLGRGEIEWFGAGSVLASTNTQLRGVIALLSSLLRIPIAGADCDSGRLEAY